MTIDETIREAAEELWNERRFGSLNVFRSILTRHFAEQREAWQVVAMACVELGGMEGFDDRALRVIQEISDTARAALSTPPKSGAKRDEAICAVAGQGWQPIETAPRDGTPILVWVPEWCRDGSPGWWVTAIRGNRAGRYSFDDGDEIVFPTYWMPVPDPPTHKEGATDAT